MKRFKKIISLLLCAASLTALVGCGSKKEGTEDIPTLTWYVVGDKQNDIASVMEKVNEITVPEIGAKLNIEFIESGAFQQKMNMVMASGEGFDLCFTGYTNVYSTAAENGGLLELDDLLKETPKLVESIPEDVWESARYNGKIYAVPNQQIMSTTWAFEIDKEYADKYNFDVDSVKKPEDLEPLLKAIKENEPTKYAYRTNYGASPWVYDKYEVYSYYIGIDKETGEVVSLLETPEWKEGSRTLNKWYNEGYIRKDVASAGNDSSEYNARRYVVSNTSWKPGIEESSKLSKGYEIAYAKYTEPYKGLGYAQSTMIGIGKNSKNPEKALKFIELINTNEELYNLICFGIEGKHYYLDENKQVEYIDNSGYAPKADWKFGNQFNAYTLKGQPEDVWEQTEKLNEEGKVTPYNGLSIDKTEFLKIFNEIDSANAQAKNTMTCSPADFDKNFDENIKALKDAGLDKLVENFKSQVAEWKKSK